MKARIPPLALSCVFLALMALLSWLFPLGLFTIPENIFLSLLFLISGAVFSIMGVNSFRKVKTTINPNKPDNASSLVISGIYSISRNPMYVGFLSFLIAWGIYLSNAFALLLPLIFILYMNKFQIPDEEEALDVLFGEEFVAYQQNVRRWL